MNGFATAFHAPYSSSPNAVRVFTRLRYNATSMSLSRSRSCSMIATRGLLTGLLILAATHAPAQDGPAEIGDARPLTADELRARWHGRLQNRAFTAHIRLDMELSGLEEQRELTVFRDDDGLATERVMIRFDAPPDLRKVALLYLEHAARPNDYFLYQPSTRRVRRLPASIVDDDVYGIDLEFLGFGVAQTEPTEVVGVARERRGGRRVYRLEERAERPNPRFDRRVTWIDAESYVPVRTEHYQRDKLVLSAESVGIRDVQGVATPTEMHFHKPVEKRRVRLRVESVDYEQTLPPDAFSILNLTKGVANH